MLKKISTLAFVSLIAFIVSCQPSFALLNKTQIGTVQTSCGGGNAEYTAEVITASDFADNIAVNGCDQDQGNTLYFFYDNQIPSTNFATEPNANANQVYIKSYPYTWPNSIGTRQLKTFYISDGQANAQANYYITITAAPITYTGPANGSTYVSGQSKTVSCTNSTYMKVNGTSVATGSSGNGYLTSYTFTTSAAVALYNIVCGNIGGDQINYTINLAPPTISLSPAAGGSALQYGSTEQATCGNATSMSSTDSYLTGTGNGAINDSWTNNLLDTTTVYVTCFNAAYPSGVGDSFNAIAKPISLSVSNQSAKTGVNSTLTWTSDAGSCEVKWTNNGSTYQSFSPVVMGSGANPARTSATWSATIPNKGLGDGVYGYQIYCLDSAHPTRAPQPATSVIKLTLSSKAIASISLNGANPNKLDWSCVNAAQSSFDNVYWSNTLSGQISNDGQSHTIYCRTSTTDTSPVSDTCYPSTLDMSSDATPSATASYTCPVGTTRAALYRDGVSVNENLQNISGNTARAGTVIDYAIQNSRTYTYGVKCYDKDNSFIAYSEKSVAIPASADCPAGQTKDASGTCKNNTSTCESGWSWSAAESKCVKDTVITPTETCSYIASTGKVSCINIPLCADGVTYATQYNDTTDGSSATPASATGNITTYKYTDPHNGNIYQYRFVCDDKIIDIKQAVVPPYSHFISFNVSSANVQKGTSINLGWIIQNPKNNCTITAKNISDGSDQAITGMDDSSVKNSITGEGVTVTTADGGYKTNGSTPFTVNQSTRFTATCTEPGFTGSALHGTHTIIKDIYVIGEKLQ